MTHDQDRRDRARELRSSMNEAEQLLWRRLRTRHNGRFRFRRQHPLGPYIADFGCAAAKLVVEVDGASHGESERQEHDRRRDAWMQRQKIAVLRFRNGAVYERMEEILQEIEAACIERTR